MRIIRNKFQKADLCKSYICTTKFILDDTITHNGRCCLSAKIMELIMYTQALMNVRKSTVTGFEMKIYCAGRDFLCLCEQWRPKFWCSFCEKRIFHCMCASYSRTHDRPSHRLSIIPCCDEFFIFSFILFSHGKCHETGMIEIFTKMKRFKRNAPNKFNFLIEKKQR